jgi:hypothetical protein
MIGQLTLATLSIRANPSSNKREPNMTDTPQYTPPDVWIWDKNDTLNWRYANVNRPYRGCDA